MIHDWSKFLPCEWIPYANYFFGKRKQMFASRFRAAWLHHQHLNPHHWQHWILRSDNGTSELIEIPESFVREMVADWCGAGRAITGKWDIRDWYEKNSMN